MFYSVASAVQELVPESCCKIVGFSEEYKEPFLCNFLGLSVGVELPAHVIASDQHVLLDILPPLKRHFTNHSPEEMRTRQLLPVTREGKGHDPLQNYKLMVYTAQPRAPEHKSKTRPSPSFILSLYLYSVNLL